MCLKYLYSVDVPLVKILTRSVRLPGFELL